MRKIDLISLSLVSLLAFSSQAFSANLVSGISGCIMKSGGIAGSATAPVSQYTEIREPASGDYMDATAPNRLFPNGRTYWGRDIGLEPKAGGSSYIHNLIFWGQLPAYTGVRVSTNLEYGIITPWALWWKGPDKWYFYSVTSQVDKRGEWTYRKGQYYGRLRYPNDVPSFRKDISHLYGDLHGVYRTKMAWINVPGNNVFEDCKSTSNASNGNWINNRFVTSQEINNAFSRFETNIETKINEKKITLSLLNPVVSSTARASTKSAASSSSALFTGVRKSNTQKDVAGSSARDATSVGGNFH